MSIKGLEGLTIKEINSELENGAKFVVYPFCISIIVLTFNRSSDVHFIKSYESPITKGLIYSLVSFLLGWWGFPWGPIHTIGSIVTNFRGGKDVTKEVIHSINQANQNQTT